MKRQYLLACLAGCMAPATLVAQTTATERAAAAEVVRQIDALQLRLQPARSAQSLAGKKDAARERIFVRVEELWQSELRDLSDHIGRNPEVGFQEFMAVDTLTTVLARYGFRVERGVADLFDQYLDSLRAIYSEEVTVAAAGRLEAPEPRGANGEVSYQIRVC
jgi:hypothetical protein